MKEQHKSTPLLPPHEGMQVQTIMCIDLYPHFLLDSVGLIGTVTLVEEHLILVKMDEFIPGCEEWDNEIQLTSDEFGDYGNGVVITSMLELFHHYFAPIQTSEEIKSGQEAG